MLVMAAGEGGGGRVGTIVLLVVAVAVELSFLEVRFVKVVKLKEEQTILYLSFLYINE